MRVVSELFDPPTYDRMKNIYAQNQSSIIVFAYVKPFMTELFEEPS